MHLNLLHLGRISYTEGLAIQQQVVDARKANRIADTLLLLEHPPVLTLGRNATRDNILASDEFLAARGVELHHTNRGGEVTYHGPGQLVGYPIVDLRGDLPGKRGPFLGPVDFVRMLEEALIRTCADYGILAKRIPKCTGVWTFGGGNEPEAAAELGAPSKLGLGGPGTPDTSIATRGTPKRERKLAAIGIHVSHSVTSHGFALNVTTDLRDFDWIVPCGIRDRGVTSLELEADSSSPPVTMEGAIHSTARHFGRVFQRQVLWTGSLDELLAPTPAPVA